MFLAAQGETDASRAALVRAMEINPESRELQALDAALEESNGKPIDGEPFLPPLE